MRRGNRKKEEYGDFCVKEDEQKGREVGKEGKVREDQDVNEKKRKVK